MATKAIPTRNNTQNKAPGAGLPNQTSVFAIFLLMGLNRG